MEFIMSCLSVGDSGNLSIGGCDVAGLAEQYGTPAYIMDEDKIRENCRVYNRAMEEYYNGNGIVLYASKALSCKYIYRIMKEENMGIDVVSGGELYTALSAFFPAEKIYFHGNNKTADELKMALESGVGRIVVDNIFELETLEELAEKLDRTVDIMFRIKPGIDAHTHSFIRTGQIDSKFGVALETGEAEEIVVKADSMERINVVGVHCHIGSQIFELEPFELAAEKMMNFIADIKEKYGIELSELNLGGGYGIKYTENDSPINYDKYIQAVSKVVTGISEARGIKLPYIVMEPGRSITAETGITVYRVGAVKEIPGVRTYISVDGGMGDNPRYILYESEYEALRVNSPADAKTMTATIAGKCCESGDILIKDAKLPAIKPGDLIAVLATGAYNYSMASNYNRIPRPPIVMVSGGESRLAVKRESYDDIIANDL
ncbi:MAG TPA: diaminopimelate decarboxylase [Candidatus Monoglobus merdigallinarum]|uniref:Diaminopimelate decarboxylase n=1 Tax=Candidatus Monoglobus merdigallinarum TaxID=2838698 RepID=A0A9D1TLQ8_9FIRM|nr:diaminopimelate decarboxylase [Candidatus Monoglobus merdigallinarum]